MLEVDTKLIFSEMLIIWSEILFRSPRKPSFWFPLAVMFWQKEFVIETFEVLLTSPIKIPFAFDSLTINVPWMLVLFICS